MPFAQSSRAIVVRQLAASAAVWLVLGIGAALAGDGSATSNPELLGLDCNCEMSLPPLESANAFYDLDWAVGLRGAYTLGSGTSYYETQLLPEFSLLHEGSSYSFGVSGDSEFDVGIGGAARIGALRLSLKADNQFDAYTTGSVVTNLALTQLSPFDSTLPANTAIAPQVFAGDATATLARQFGKVSVALRGELSRDSSGPTTLTDMSVIDNSGDNNWVAGTGLRLGYQLTPILTTFVDGSVGFQRYDIPSPSLMVYLDGRIYKGLTGITAKWNDVLSGEASVGVGYLDYVDGSLPDAVSALYDASLKFNPDPTLGFTADLSTTMAPSTTSPLSTQVTYKAEGQVAYLVNPLLTLKSNASWNRSITLGTPDVEDTYEAGVGAELQTGEHMRLTGDYGYKRVVSTSAPTEDSHMVAVGVKYSR